MDTTTDTTTTDLPPNHHAGHPGFSGVSGHLYALLFALHGRRDPGLPARLGQVGPGDVVVDIGCGPGTALRAAARLGATGTGVDPSDAMLRVARLLTRRRRVAFERGVAESVPVPDGTATVVWSEAAVHHWADVDGGLAEVARILRPGGRFVAIERRSPVGAQGVASHGWTDDQASAFAARCRELGFVDIRIERHEGHRGPVHAVLASKPAAAG